MSEETSEKIILQECFWDDNKTQSICFYTTACDNAVLFDMRFPKFIFCPYCGKKIVEKKKGEIL